MSPVEYLEWEAQQETRHELVDRYLYATTGASLRHDEIAMNIASALHQHLKDGPCRVYKSDIKVRVANDFYYPDIVVRCGDRDDSADDFSTLTRLALLRCYRPVHKDSTGEARGLHT